MEGHNLQGLLANLPHREQKRLVARYFSAVFGEENVLTTEGNPEWYGRKVPAVEPQVVKEVTWELCEVGFRVELRHLDRFLVWVPVSASLEQRTSFELNRERMLEEVFDGRPLVSDALPTTNTGLAADNIQDRAASLNGLRRLMQRWPEVPSTIRDCPMLGASTAVETLRRAESELSRYYCQTFWELAGCPPILPRRLPL